MAKKKQEGVSRRDFIKWTGSGALAAGAGSGPFFLFPETAAAQQKTLKILQWSHFVPRTTPGSTVPSASNGDKNTTRTSSSTTSTLLTFPRKLLPRPLQRRGTTFSCCSRRPRPTRSKPLTCPTCTRKWRRSTARRSIRAQIYIQSKDQALLRFFRFLRP